MTGMEQMTLVKTDVEAEPSEPPAGRDPVGLGAYSFSSEVVMLSDPRGARAEGIRALRTYIMAQHVDDGRRGLAVCAATEGVGASFTAVNLAVALAQIGVKVLLVDGDLRHPALEQFIATANNVTGLRQCLASEDPLGAPGIQVDVIENLSVMYSGGSGNNAQELLATENFGILMERCLRDFDLTIVDTPSASSCADARRISNVIGYSLIVARRNESFVSDISALANQLTEDRAKIVGTVMTEA
ncbi:MAG: CpsD/CapB family tyrosine-protein kinase [Hyphomonadaceae bacterium]|nr:CpsD/CapB family tyrosine-protein kinase [Hyphomonadaceae bacterium]